MARTLGPAAATWTGWLVLCAPFLALFVKFFAPGWLIVMLFFSFPITLGIIGLYIAVAVTGFLRRNAAFRVTPGGVRGAAAALTSGAALIGIAFFIPDGGDDGRWSSPMLNLFGRDEYGAWGDATGTLAGACAVVWVVSSVWALLEWIAALRRRRELTKAPAGLSGRQACG